ncbi:ATP-binding protein [Streptomyces sp. NPDC087300]|uniref:ATP-binding protein n=1 Tax=Streptomyces sp. NPDC087300 TaxID=3365780 RepID=UPI00381C02F6
MKQSAVKTLGVAALGAAFAAAGAGAATAAPALPDATGALGTVSSVLPLDQAAKTLPAGAPESLTAGQNALSGGLAGVEKPGPGDPVSGLLGGLPVAGATGALPLG